MNIKNIFSWCFVRKNYSNITIRSKFFILCFSIIGVDQTQVFNTDQTLSLHQCHPPCPMSPRSDAMVNTIHMLIHCKGQISTLDSNRKLFNINSKLET